MKKIFLFLFVIFFGSLNLLQAQIQAVQSKAADGFPQQKGNWILSLEDSLRLVNLPEYIPPLMNIQARTTYPAVFDNSTQPYFRPLFNDVAYECGQASGVALGFTYELNYKRNSDASLPENQIPTHFVYNFHNDGETYVGVSYFDSWEVLREMGSPSVADYGGMWIGTSSTRNKIWISGYNKYYAGMHNRSPHLYALKVNTPEGLNTLKGWVYDHSGTDTVGGVANFYSKYMGNGSMDLLPSASPEAGKYVVTDWGYSNHGMTIVGWNDSIRFDYNNDGQFTNNIDINGDNRVDMQDWEIGGLIFANTYGNYGGNSWGNQGFAYMMYATLAKPYGSGGIWNNSVHLFQAKENVDPLLTYKIYMSHTSRNKLRVYAGISSDTAANTPEQMIQFHAFSGENGDFYLLGGNSPSDQYLEIGFDISPLLNAVPNNQAAKFFFTIEEIDPLDVGEGQIINCSLMDYTGSSLIETPFPESNVSIINDSLTSISLIYQPTFSDVQIQSGNLQEATVGSPFQETLSATGGTTPYSWQLMYDYTESVQSDSMPYVTAEQIFTSNYNNGTAGHSLDFDFPFYGNTFDSVVVYNDGYLLFEFDNFTWAYYRQYDLLFKLHRMIAPFMGDLVFNTSAGDGIFYEGDMNSATFRWKGYIAGQSSSEINFAIRLFPDGKIEVFYGNISFVGTVNWIGGISEGDYDNYLIHSYSGANLIPADTKITFTPRNYPESLALSSDGVITCTPMQAYEPLPLKIRVTDNNDLYDEKDIFFHTNGFDGVVLQSLNIEAGGDSLIEYGETVSLGLNLSNLDNQNIDNGQLYLTCTDAYAQITDSLESFVSIAALGDLSLPGAFSFQIPNEIPNGHPMNFHCQIIASNDTSDLFFTLHAYRPIVSFVNSEIEDGANQVADPGENVYFNIELKNKGGAPAYNVATQLICYDPYVSISGSTNDTLSMSQASSETLSYPFQIHPNAVVSHFVECELVISVPGMPVQVFHPGFMIGSFIEDWEVSPQVLDWNYGGNTNWFLSSYLPGEGTTCLQSGDIEDNEDSWFYIEGDVATSGTLSFMYKVSCEDDPNNNNYDYLVFSIDGTEMARWDGIQDWQTVSYTVNSGHHSFLWTYHKDYSVSTGDDCAWVDYIVLPALDLDWGPPALAVSATDSSVCLGDSLQLFAFTDGIFQGPLSYSWSPANGLSDPTIPNPVLFPGQPDTYTLTVSDGVNSLNASVPVEVFPVPTAPLIFEQNDTLFSNYSFGNYWFSADGILLSEEGFFFVPESDGLYYAQAMNNYGCFSESSDTLYVLLNIEIPLTVQNIQIYPNPSSGKITFDIQAPEKDFTIDLYTSEGKHIARINQNQAVYENKRYIVQLNLLDYAPQLSNGTYICRIILDGKTLNKTIIIRKE